ncbi:MAG: hypothetical protein BGO12_11945 [Verrucomicrobia bacterium 61-8]|nr:FUSC family protein [Verrucomicrobiota bacterium]OJV13166.1 MAG: hypothetical protein BGO12_11945 [Verrucomicrobia bacterium 61-8]
MTASALMAKCAAEIQGRLGLRLGLVISLYIGLYLATGQNDILSVAVLAGGLYIASEGLRLGYWLTICHYLIGLSAFLLLYLTIGIPWLFALLCGALALGVISLTRLAAELRPFGNWIFIPAVYLACELGENRSWPQRLASLPETLLYSLIGLAAVLLLMFSRKKKPAATLSLLTARLGDPNLQWKRQAVAAFFAVLTVAGVAITFQLPNSQWMIWSSLSVIAIDLPASRAKLGDRMFGTIVGCPPGFLCGWLLPRNETVFALATLGILLSLVAFRTYRVGFTVRCALTALAAVAGGGSASIAEQRVGNVIIGGIIGLVAQHLAEWVARARRLKR